MAFRWVHATNCHGQQPILKPLNFIPEGDHFHIRWFTPKAEVRLCGHATLDTAHILFNELEFKGEALAFESKSGMLTVKKVGEKLQLDLPADFAQEVEPVGLFTEVFRSTTAEIPKRENGLPFVVRFGRNRRNYKTQLSGTS